MNWVQIKQILTLILSNVASFIVAKGWLPMETATEFVSIAVAIVGAIFAWKFGTTPNLVQAAAASPDVKNITVSRSLDDKLTADPTITT